VVVVCEEEDIVPGEARGFKSTNSSQSTNWSACGSAAADIGWSVDLR
jgi:hypothetical protein